MELIKAVKADQNPVAVYLVHLSPGSRRTMLQELDNIAGRLAGVGADVFPWHELRYQHTQAIKAKLIEAGYKPKTINKALSALRGVLKQAWLLGLMSAEDYHKAAAVQNVKENSLPAGREITLGEVEAILQACNHPRDAAVIALLYSTGIRRGELVALNIADYDQETGELRVIKGKGAKDRVLWVTNGAKDALDDWLNMRGSEPGALFCPVNKGGKVLYTRMTTQALWGLVKRRANDAGVKDIRPHDFRRSFVSVMLDRGADLSIVADLAGHSNVQTTKRYDRRGETAKRKAVELIHIPYHSVK